MKLEGSYVIYFLSAACTALGVGLIALLSAAEWIDPKIAAGVAFGIGGLCLIGIAICMLLDWRM